jgi:hypothetical protein
LLELFGQSNACGQSAQGDDCPDEVRVSSTARDGFFLPGSFGFKLFDLREMAFNRMPPYTDISA